MAASYDAGRALTQATIDAWSVAVRSILDGRECELTLDLGAGTGRFSGLLHEWTGAAVVAVEPADAMRRKLKEKALGGVRAVVGASGEALPFVDAAFDGAWLSQVVQHFDDFSGVSRELARVLRENGVVMIRGVFGHGGAEYGRTTNALLYEYFPEALNHAKKYPDRDAVLTAFRRAGFQTDAVRSVEQVIAQDLAAYLEKVRVRADSTLAAIDDAAFERGVHALAEAVQNTPNSDPIVEELDLLVLRRQP